MKHTLFLVLLACATAAVAADPIYVPDPSRTPGAFNPDITLESPKNLWPQPWHGEWGAHKKDRLEFALYKAACKGEITLTEARAAFTPAILIDAVHRCGHRDAPKQIPQQHRRAGPPRRQRIVRPVPGFKNFCCASILIAGIEIMHMIKKGQLDCPEGQASSAADQFYSLAF